MKTEWDYTNLAEAYLHRPEYAPDAITKMLSRAGVRPGDAACDVGAGAAHLTLELAKFGLRIWAVEPNDAMRANGIKRTQGYPNVRWFEGVGEDTGMEDRKFDLVTFGSSFNVCARRQALAETSRILKPKGWFACMWNHRDLDDPLQKQIEDVIKANIADYSYGTRREDQTKIIEGSGLFGPVEFISGQIKHRMLAADFIEGWKSHGTVYRQSPKVFEKIVSEIRQVVEALQQETITVPYTTRIWMAQKKS
ncbi:MAG: methyltransferase domain-containing protein [Oscillospiraceae bacterium]|nr:methyltransferase domain-containing protein [Oscillospiraceae bacterium]